MSVLVPLLQNEMLAEPSINDGPSASSDTAANSPEVNGRRPANHMRPPFGAEGSNELKRWEYQVTDLT
ncbi:hypothetical protein N7539_008910 [Penicillium diatomitis]|uniref:Uncharacterized protein n=1 Tax=Penicillium diatomitis TaxID=2819901 RepID=A0A9W9WLC4_9EURO|nr:uncharacterized protein N7539_008910 [Penicillium diatomitis]KAJ5469292.1 hypothetical protein N7539_008910 [Penicillium diatomitis]